MASETPTFAWQITVDAGADAYVATLRSTEAHEADVVVRLPRRTVDDVVLSASGIRLELPLDGSVAAYSESSGARTLARASLGALIGEAISPGALSAEEEPTLLEGLDVDFGGSDVVIAGQHCGHAFEQQLSA